MTSQQLPWVALEQADRIATVTRMAGEGHTALYVARSLDTTRSSVLGLAHRSGIQFGVGLNPAPSARNRKYNGLPEPEAPIKVPPRPKKQKAPRPKMSTRTGFAGPPKIKPEPLATRAGLWQPIEGVSVPKLLHECENHHCRWPLFTEGQPKLFCGADVTGTRGVSYCQQHYNLS